MNRLVQQLVIAVIIVLVSLLEAVDMGLKLLNEWRKKSRKKAEWE